MGKSSINGPFSMAMLNNQRVKPVTAIVPAKKLNIRQIPYRVLLSKFFILWRLQWWFWLVVSTSLKNRKVSWDNEISNGNMFQTTSQYTLLLYCYGYSGTTIFVTEPPAHPSLVKCWNFRWSARLREHVATTCSKHVVVV